MDKKPIDNSKQPKIKIETVLFPEVAVNRSPGLNISPNIDISINDDYLYDEEKEMLQVHQTIVVSEEETDEEIIRVLGIAIFKIEKENEIDKKMMSMEYFATHNAPAIIYPYMREFISYISLKAGIEPIILPIANFHAIAKIKESENK